ncbi:SGNH/GDSL hydrolase family protein [Arthrobacter sp. MPF02]|uniref:SGNH/GDSL hydrolase family protein n=1 Tax=Arthrobacter sp. MPF02 TaxID=3388492 RepID=UPI003984CF2E
MGTTGLRRRHTAFAAVLATFALALGLTAAPAGAAPARDVDYVAFGDSYTAGTGAGAPYRPANVACWQSSGGYVDVVAKTGRIDVVANKACHGAVLDSDSRFYDREIIIPTVMEQILMATLARQLSHDTELVSITAGANDLGFASVIGACASGTSAECSEALAIASDPATVEQMQTNLVEALVWIRTVAPHAKIAVLGYPYLFDPASPFAPIPPETQLVINQAADGLNTILKGTVQVLNQAYGNFQFVDVRNKFIGHAVNSVNPWLQLLLAQPTPDYNFHPNKEGHRAYASALLEAVKPAQLARP